jgi:SAM-dependent methyltransferase
MTSEHQHQAAGDATRFWEQRYGERDQIWTGRVNAVLAEIAGGLEVGRALDLGCGEGGDAIWLAGMGWRVTAADISETALSRARDAAVAAGVDSRITFERRDLADDFPSGAFDLVSSQYLHSPVEFPRAAVLQQAAQAVALGGRLLIVDHGAPPPWAVDHSSSWADGGAHEPPSMPTVLETFDSLQLADDHWRVDRLEAVHREATGPNGETGMLLDNIILTCRLA